MTACRSMFHLVLWEPWGHQNRSSKRVSIHPRLVLHFQKLLPKKNVRLDHPTHPQKPSEKASTWFNLEGAIEKLGPLGHHLKFIIYIWDLGSCKSSANLETFARISLATGITLAHSFLARLSLESCFICKVCDSGSQWLIMVMNGYPLVN